MKHIDNARPGIFLLENVKNFVFLDNKAYYKYLLEGLNQIRDDQGEPAYQIGSRFLCPTEIGFPQKRSRIYIYGINTAKSPKAFGEIELGRGVDIDTLLDAPTQDDDPTRLPPAESHARKQVEGAIEHIRSKDEDPGRDHWIIDCDASERYRTQQKNAAHALLMDGRRVYGYRAEDVVCRQGRL